MFKAMPAKWVEGFLAAARRRGLSDLTIHNYGAMLDLIVNHYRLDLEHCTEEELLAGLDQMRRGHELDYYRNFVSLTRAGLQFLGRTDCEGSGLSHGTLSGRLRVGD